MANEKKNLRENIVNNINNKLIVGVVVVVGECDANQKLKNNAEKRSIINNN